MTAKTITYSYPAYIAQQTPTGKPLVFFAAPATEIEEWVGVPQRSRLDQGETIGFQRQENKNRISELSRFYHDERNIVQNPLLGAPQSETFVIFKAHEGHSHFGALEIVSQDFSETSLLSLMSQVVERLMSRVPELRDASLDQDRLSAIIEKARKEHGLSIEAPEDEDEDDIEVANNDDADATSVLLTDETHLIDFYTELQGRIKVLEALDPDMKPDQILGFDREAMISHLKPVMLVDGQHRLRGAVLAAELLADDQKGEEFLLKAVEDGREPTEAKAEYVRQHVRCLPVSLLMDSSPSEHVFQFVVVNQKATPMGKALLGTIVSTSLSKDELSHVAERLKDADIKLDDSQAIAYLTRADESPFKNCVQTGIKGAGGDRSTALQWAVLKGLVSVFRELSGGKIYGEPTDWARVWGKHHLDESELVADFDTHEEKLAEWKRPDGPWRDIFIRFYSNIRERFGSEDPEAHNAWGTTQSNLFNKVSLTILAADYFEFLRMHKRTLNSTQDVDSTMDEWLEGVNNTYFNRNWKVDKKDTPAVRKRWASLWHTYRKNPESLPKEGQFNPVAAT
ncbi:UNVERIFIED_ORG: hypothetical protein FHR35_006983 [Microbispora rosea subsp. rosea]